MTFISEPFDLCDGWSGERGCIVPPARCSAADSCGFRLRSARECAADRSGERVRDRASLHQRASRDGVCPDADRIAISGGGRRAAEAHVSCDEHIAPLPRQLDDLLAAPLSPISTRATRHRAKLRTRGSAAGGARDIELPVSPSRRPPTNLRPRGAGRLRRVLSAAASKASGCSGALCVRGCRVHYTASPKSSC